MHLALDEMSYDIAQKDGILFSIPDHDFRGLEKDIQGVKRLLSTADIGQIEIPENVRKAADTLGLLLSDFEITKKLQIEQESDEIVSEYQERSNTALKDISVPHSVTFVDNDFMSGNKKKEKIVSAGKETGVKKNRAILQTLHKFQEQVEKGELSGKEKRLDKEIQRKNDVT